MLIWSREAFISALGLALAYSLWQGALVGAMAVVLNSCLKRAPADARYAACGLLLLTLVIAWLGSLACFYSTEVRVPAAPGAAGPFSTLPALPAEPPHLRSGALYSWTLRSFAPSLVLLWTLGVSLLSIRHLLSLLALRRLQTAGTAPCPPEWQERIKSLAIRMGLRREVLVRLSRRVDVPLTFGVLKPYLLLPPSVMMGLSAEQLEALIAHELAHIRQHDSLINLLQICAETLLFYHPAVWWLSAQMRVAREQRCDDLAVRIVGDHALYARALLTMEELRAPIPHLALGASGGSSHMSNSSLIQRIQRVLGAHSPEKRAPWMAGTLALCMASVGLATLWPVHAHSAPLPGAPHPAAAKRMEGQQTVTTSANKGFPISLGTGVNGKSIGLTIYTKAPDLTPETPITVEGQRKQFGDLSADDQSQLRMVVAAALQNWRTSWRIGLGTSVNGKSIGLTVDAKMLDLPPETLITVEGQQKRFGDLSADDQNQIRKAVEDTRVEMEIAPEAPVAVNGQKQSDVVIHQFKVGNNQAKVFGDTLKPDTIVVINGVRSRFKDLSASRQKQIQAAWSHESQTSHL